MTRIVRAPYTTGCCCPVEGCGRPVFWVGRWTKDHNSPDGVSYKHEPWTITVDERLSSLDKPVTEVKTSGAYDVETKQRWRHVVTMACREGHWSGDERQALHRPIPSDDELNAWKMYHQVYLEVDDG